MSKTNKSYNKFSNIPSSENTDNKESTKDHSSAATREVDEGVVDSVRDTLFTDSELEILFILVNTEIDLDNTEETIFPLHQLKSIQKKLLSLFLSRLCGGEA